jgi:hypothetical protein
VILMAVLGPAVLGGAATLAIVFTRHPQEIGGGKSEILYLDTTGRLPGSASREMGRQPQVYGMPLLRMSF